MLHTNGVSLSSGQCLLVNCPTRQSLLLFIALGLCIDCLVGSGDLLYDIDHKSLSMTGQRLDKWLFFSSSTENMQGFCSDYKWMLKGHPTIYGGVIPTHQPIDLQLVTRLRQSRQQPFLSDTGILLGWTLKEKVTKKIIFFRTRAPLSLPPTQIPKCFLHGQSSQYFELKILLPQGNLEFIDLFPR